MIRLGVAGVILSLGMASTCSEPIKKKDLIGAWLYQRAYTQFPDGEKKNQFGPSPTGLFIILPNGHYEHVVINGDLKPLSSAVLKDLSDKDARTVATGTLVHFGTWTADEKAGTFTVIIKKASFPNFDGLHQVRTILELTKKTMRYKNAQTTSGDGAVVYATLSRVW